MNMTLFRMPYLFSKATRLCATLLLSIVFLSACQGKFLTQLTNALEQDEHEDEKQTLNSSAAPQQILHCAAEFEPHAISFEELFAADKALHDDLFDRLRQGFALDLEQDNPRIKAQRDWYARHQNYINRVFTRAERYIYYMLDEAERRNIPTEMVLLPVVESAFDPFAYSHGRASGPWQFIPSTGEYYGLKQGYWYDGRRDIVQSTEAAYAFLDALQRQFDGDWLLALAAYNAGGGNVRKAVRRTKKAGKPIDFWSLKLPQETQAYAPKLIAIAQIVAEPQKYGITLPKINNHPRFELVDIGSQLDLSQAAKLAQIPLDELYKFNPGFNRWATDPQGPHRLLIPAENAEAFRQNLSKLPSSARVKWQHYKVRSGDTLSTIAKRYKTTSNTLKKTNKLRSNTIRIGQQLLIPTAMQGKQSYALAEDNRKARIINKNKQGKVKKVVTVQSGDSMWSIAKRYNLKTRVVAKWNAMAPTDPLAIGDELTLWLDASDPAVALSQGGPATDKIMRRIKYSVRRGDSLAKIAGKFNVSIKQIESWNNLQRSQYLQPGQRLSLLVDVRGAY